jgi:hypothetical protein
MVHSRFPWAVSTRLFIRSFAEIVTENPTRHRKLKRREARLLAGPALSESPPTPELSKPKKKLIQKIPVREDHGLYAFFRRKSDDTLKGEDRFEVVESPEAHRVPTGTVVSAVIICLY